MLEEASGKYYPSTVHRVLNPTGEAATKSRISLPLFLHPRREVVLSERYTVDSYFNERMEELRGTKYIDGKLVRDGWLSYRDARRKLRNRRPCHPRSPRNCCRIRR